jgi:Na+-translocating ferredoxin:NAD+ oxidoreductase RnfD subunit
MDQTVESVFPGTAVGAPRARPRSFRESVARVFPDPRVPVLVLLAGYLILGFTTLGWNRSPMQVAVTSVSACALELFLAWCFGRKREFPTSALITSLGLSILLNYSHSYSLLLVPVFYAIGAKYVFTFKGRHVYNPAQIGVVLCLLTTQELITSAPAYQWYGVTSMAYFILFPALMFFMPSIDRTPLVSSFMLTFTAQTALRAMIMRHHLPFQTLFLGTLSSPSFLLFSFFMITDPRTSPSDRKEQVRVGIALALIDLLFHIRRSYYTFFYAAFTLATIRLVWNHWKAARAEGYFRYAKQAFWISGYWKRPALLGAMAATGVLAYRLVIFPVVEAGPLPWTMKEIPAEQTGIHATWGRVYERIDPRAQNIAKWLFSVGDAVAVGDFDGDGLPDLFLTLPLESAGDRMALYRNLGGYRFERVPLPALGDRPIDLEKYGVATGATWVDYDNDGDLDLFITYAFGHPVLLKNMLKETGKATFVDVTHEVGLDHFTNSVVATWADIDGDGRLDLIIGNVLPTNLPDYKTPHELSLFHLPQPEFPGDRRMFHFMHESWNNATNGGLNELYLQKTPGHFEKQDAAAWGMPETHWTLAISAADLNHDGLPDLYMANDFGPDDLYFNEGGKHFYHHMGKLFGSVGRDTYKGMNSSLGDLTRSGWQDIYISDVHHEMQAEGSLLWMFSEPGQGSFIPEIVDRATEMGALNERRFGWGAAIADFDNDGWLDIAQANGMVDDTPEKLSGTVPKDRKYDDCPDYWYVNEKIMRSPPSIHSYSDAWGDIQGMCIYGREKNRMYLNRGNGAKPQFIDVADKVGMGTEGTSRAMAAVDLDNSGRLDLVTTHMFSGPTIYRNSITDASAAPAHWLGIALEADGARCNRDAIGSRVTLTYRGVDGKRIQQMDEKQVMSGFGAQGDRRLHFGLGGAQGPVDVQVLWCGKWEEHFQVTAPDRYLSLKMGV